MAVMGRPKGKNPNKSNVNISISVSAMLREQIKYEATRQGISPSTLCRNIIAQALQTNNAQT